jgi:hypothetical protein
VPYFCSFQWGQDHWLSPNCVCMHWDALQGVWDTISRRTFHNFQLTTNLIDLLEIITGLSGEAVMISNTFSVITRQI